MANKYFVCTGVQLVKKGLIVTSKVENLTRKQAIDARVKARIEGVLSEVYTMPFDSSKSQKDRSKGLDGVRCRRLEKTGDAVYGLLGELLGAVAQSNGLVIENGVVTTDKNPEVPVHTAFEDDKEYTLYQAAEMVFGSKLVSHVLKV